MLRPKNFKSSYGSHKSAIIGERGENSFMAYAERNGWNPRPASRHEDRELHIDVWVDLGGYRTSIDVKGHKEGIDRGLITVEIMNVNGHIGWLFGSADLIAFNVGTHWEVVERTKLLAFMDNRMNKNDGWLNEKLQSRNKFCLAPNWYRRFGRLDAITNIKIADLKSL